MITTFSINNDRPWLDQLDEIKTDLVYRALSTTGGNQAKAAKLLGMSERHIRNYIKNNDQFKKFRKEKVKDMREAPKVKALFQMSLTPTEISYLVDYSYPKVREILLNQFDESTYKTMLRRNNDKQRKEKRTMENIEQILEGHRVLLASITEKVRDQKLHELDTEQMNYAQILFQNGFITKEGHVTEEGKEALYN